MLTWIKCTHAAAWAAALCFLSSAVAAQQLPTSDLRVPDNGTNGEGMDTHLFRPALDSKGFFSVNGSDIIGTGQYSFGMVLDYGRNLMRTRSGEIPRDTAGVPCESEACVFPLGQGAGVDALVADSFQGTFGFNYGIANLAVVGLTIPVVLMTGDEAYEIGPTGAPYNTAALDAQTVGSLAAHAKIRLLRVQRGLGVAAVVQAGVSLGDAPRALGADPGFWYWPQLVVERHFGFTRRFKLGLNAGYRGHTGENPRFGNDASGQPQLAEGLFEYGNLGTFGAGLSYRATDGFDIVAETYGSYLLAEADNKQKLSQEAVGGFKLFVEKNSFLMLGAGSGMISTGFQAADYRLVLGFVFEPSIGDRDGDGYPDDQDACPDEPEDFDGFEDDDGCPEPDNDKDGIPDNVDRCPNVPEDFDGDEDNDGCPESKPEGDRDGDGIPDSKDKCPDDPEDRDGFEDDDGCPEHDNDKDGIPDKVDRCPNDPETFNGFEDEDGCPDKGLVLIEGSDIVILQKVQFQTGSAKILPESFPIIDAVAATMKAHAEFLVVEVAGHADERSTDEYNLKLTKARAASVVAALVERGIEKSRLVSQGYGEYCPLDKRSTPEAWDLNRRVEFKVVKTHEGLSDADRGCDTASAAGARPPPVK
jgi:outer membrane protein OmpA-like peptidoglycan-associated protein